MSNTIAVNEPRSLDEFAGWTDEVDSHDDEQLSERSIIGQRLKFTNEGQWQLPDKTEPTKSLIVVNARRSAVKWGKTKGRPLETEFVKAGERFPDLKTRNAALPPSEWIADFNGNPKGPWEAQHIVYLVDPISIDQYTYPTSTTGGHIAVQELVERVNWMRRFRGPATYPIVQLATRFMKTKYGGGRLRPHFSIVDWTKIDQAAARSRPASHSTCCRRPSKPSSKR